MKTKNTYTKNLKVGDKVAYNGGLFEVTEEPVNHGQEVSALKYEVVNDEFDVWTAKCKRIDTENMGHDWLMDRYDSFQSNSLRKCNAVILPR